MISVVWVCRVLRCLWCSCVYVGWYNVCIPWQMGKHLDLVEFAAWCSTHTVLHLFRDMPGHLLIVPWCLKAHWHLTCYFIFMGAYEDANSTRLCIKVSVITIAYSICTVYAWPGKGTSTYTDDDMNVSLFQVWLLWEDIVCSVQCVCQSSRHGLPEEGGDRAHQAVDARFRRATVVLGADQERQCALCHARTGQT